MRLELVDCLATGPLLRHADRSRSRAPGTSSHRATPVSGAICRVDGTIPTHRAPCPRRHGACGRSLLVGDSYRGGQSVEWSFGSVSHEHLQRFVAHRVGDKNLLRLIQRFLKAGVLEDGAFSATDEGTPQGNLVSPVLSNIYLHYALDVWFERRFARQCQGKAFLVRYCDDFVACFESETDTRTFEQQLKERLSQFKLEVEPTKSALYRFGTLAPLLCKRDGLKRPLRSAFWASCTTCAFGAVV